MAKGTDSIDIGGVNTAESEKKPVFDPDKFVQAVVSQNADILTGFFTSDAVICWHDSNEQFTAAEYIKANCEYPAEWSGEIQRVNKIDGGFVIVTKICSKTDTVFVCSFIELRNGKICRMDEYYSSLEEVPEWRSNLNIGTTIMK